MKIVVCHNYYQQPGGEDQVFAEEADLLAAHGHDVVRFTVHNDELKQRGGITGRLSLARDTVWNGAMYRRVRQLVARERAEVVHFHNTFPLMSPAAYYGARAGGAAVVQTLHNYRFVCPNAQFFRDGRVCEDCLGKLLPWPGVLHACYRGSRAATAVTAGMLAAHRVAGTYHRTVDLYLALTSFARDRYVRGGLPASRVVVKQNFIAGERPVGQGGGGFGLFVGRLDLGKGVRVLLDAWARLTGPTQLKIVGDGEMAPQVRAAAARDSRIEFLGRRPSAEVYSLMGEAGFLVLPALWYEGMPRTIVESFCVGTPVLTSQIGALPEMVEHGGTGLCFAAGDADDLCRQVARMQAEPAAVARMRDEARCEYEKNYTPAQNYGLLMGFYQQALQNRWSKAAEPVEMPATLQLTVHGRPPAVPAVAHGAATSSPSPEAVKDDRFDARRGGER